MKVTASVWMMTRSLSGLPEAQHERAIGKLATAFELRHLDIRFATLTGGWGKKFANDAMPHLRKLEVLK